jgi:HSP20 family molecular chaperone IbpA
MEFTRIVARSRQQSPTLLLGLDDLERLMDELARQTGSAGYPPYNITRIDGVGPDGGDVLRITLAVAGFGADDLEIQVEGPRLTVSGRQAPVQGATYLHHGIAGRPFRRTFSLCDGLTVIDAILENGLLNVDLMQPQTGGEPRRITVTKRG